VAAVTALKLGVDERQSKVATTTVRPKRVASRWRLRHHGPARPLQCALLYTGIPVLLLVLYVGLWTGAMRSGYREMQLRNGIAQLRIENDLLQARVIQYRAPRRIAAKATAIGMQQAEQIEYLPVQPQAQR
jgi:hypothetical protein